MAVRRLASDEIQPKSFALSADAEAWAQAQIAKYPEGRQASAVVPLLWKVQGDCGGWLPQKAIEAVAERLDMAYIRVLEVATFYTMFNMRPVGRYHVQVCGTTPCMLQGADDVFAACYARGMKKGATTEDGLFTLTEVECLGACANAPMIQINDDNYEDLTFESTTAVLDALASGRTPRPGSQTGRQASVPAGGPTSLPEMARENHDYRELWK